MTTTSTVVLPLDGCFEDSPFFRADLALVEQNTGDFEATAKSLLKLARTGVDSSRVHTQKSVQFANELLRFAQSERRNEDHAIDAGLDKFGETLREIESFRSILNDQTEMVLIEPLERFVKNDLGTLAAIQKQFLRNSDDYDSQLNKYLGRKAPADESQEVKQVTQAHMDFHTSSLDYVLKLNELQAKKKFEFLEKVLAYLYAQMSFHHQAYELLHDLQPFMTQLTAQLHQVRHEKEAEHAQNNMRKETIVQACTPFYPPTAIPPPSVTLVRENMSDSADDGIVAAKQGYLFKKSSQKLKLNEWQRRYFVIRGGLLIYYTRGKDNEEPTVATNLRVCTVKLVSDSERRFCFQIISPIRSYVLQASSAEDASNWVSAITQAIGVALSSPDMGDFGMNKEKKEKLPKGMVVPPQRRLQEPQQTKQSPLMQFMSPKLAKYAGRASTALASAVGVHRDPSSSASAVSGSISKESISSVAAGFPPDRLPELRAREGNAGCADCGAPAPDWCSITQAVLLCIECSGIHRSLGTHLSKVRSITLDIWDTNLQKIFLSMGNSKVNAILEADRRKAGLTAPEPTSSRPDKEAWIKAKYQDLAMVVALDNPDVALFDAVLEGNIVDMLAARCSRANLNSVHGEHGCTPLIQAIGIQSDLCVEWLLLWGADVQCKDNYGQTPLIHAALVSKPKYVAALLKRHAKLDDHDNAGKTALDHATENGSADVIALLRSSGDGTPDSFSFDAGAGESASATPPTERSADPDNPFL